MYFGLTENGICDFFRYYFSFLGNFDRIVNNKDTINSFIGSGVLWSIGIEEQFYLLYPIIILIFRKKNTGLFICLSSIYLITLVSKIFIIKYYTDYSLACPTLQFSPISAFDGVSFGGLLAYISIYYKDVFVKLINKIPNLEFIISLLIFILVAEYFIENISFTECISGQAYILFFAIIISFYCFNQKASMKSNNRVIQGLNYLGKISFGLYIFHVIIIS